MKFVQKTLASMALTGLVMAQPIVAQAAAPADRTGAKTGKSDELGGGISAFAIIGIFGGLLLLAELTDLIDVFGNDNELPHSP